jgi:hypothetical protein
MKLKLDHFMQIKE